MPDLNDADIADGLRLDAARTPGEWMVEHFTGAYAFGVTAGIWEVTSPAGAPASERYSVTEDMSEETATFIAHAANHYGDALRVVREQAAELERLRSAIAEHHRQKADDRCIEDDDRLYTAAGLPPCDRRVGDKAAMLENCRRFIERRCEGGGWPTYAELESELARLRAVAAAAEGLREAADKAAYLLFSQSDEFRGLVAALAAYDAAREKP